MKTINVKLTIDVPKVPNFLRTSDGQSVPLCAITDDGLREIIGMAALPNVES